MPIGELSYASNSAFFMFGHHLASPSSVEPINAIKNKIQDRAGCTGYAGERCNGRQYIHGFFRIPWSLMRPRASAPTGRCGASCNLSMWLVFSQVLNIDAAWRHSITTEYRNPLWTTYWVTNHQRGHLPFWVCVPVCILVCYRTRCLATAVDALLAACRYRTRTIGFLPQCGMTAPREGAGCNASTCCFFRPEDRRCHPGSFDDVRPRTLCLRRRRRD